MHNLKTIENNLRNNKIVRKHRGPLVSTVCNFKVRFPNGFFTKTEATCPPSPLSHVYVRTGKGRPGETGGAVPPPPTTKTASNDWIRTVTTRCPLGDCDAAFPKNPKNIQASWRSAAG